MTGRDPMASSKEASAARAVKKEKKEESEKSVDLQKFLDSRDQADDVSKW
jgi:hypothetical protein